MSKLTRLGVQFSALTPGSSQPFRIDTPGRCVLRGIWVSPGREHIFEFTSFLVDGVAIFSLPAARASSADLRTGNWATVDTEPQEPFLGVVVVSQITGTIRNMTRPGDADAITLCPSFVFDIQEEV